MKLPPNILDDGFFHNSHYVHQLCVPGAVLRMKSCNFIEQIVEQGYATRSGTYPLYTYIATQKLLDWADDQNRTRPSFSVALEKIDVKKARAKYMADRRRDREQKVRVPGVSAIQHQVLIEAQAPDGITVNEDGDVSGRGLTDWYVKKYCQMNNLKV